jgi:hypothetical protein
MRNVLMGIAGENIGMGDAVELDVGTGWLIKVRPTEQERVQQMKDMICEQLDRSDLRTIVYEANTDILTQPTGMGYMAHRAGTTHVSLNFDIQRKENR